MSDFKQRLEAEQAELKDKLSKLNGFIGTGNFNKVDKDQKTLLKIQSSAMETYLKCLTERLERL
ncbi:crAss001_48 related protein [Wenyingzhuangia sp. 2_MG-2023]|uniref:crAss001_48 related protein n=1 Tax=Wenyingzhuangia sp. 2_MG-2023 TaxID=3062639 RepID=UPI0026E344F7|nr:hypothetical protein [Wenyingzhuangia sp. 2_MG-2023]MDO6737131.1 hypothetical protein [Wenyingzhuangia sp. 2_MG-2023]